MRIDHDGMDMDHLEAVLRANPSAKLIYTVPDFQNPTGVTLVVLVAAISLIETGPASSTSILEDFQHYRPLRFEGSHLPTQLESLGHGRPRSLRRQLLQIMAPGMRLGCKAVAAAMCSKKPRLLLKLTADTQCSTLNMMAASLTAEPPTLSRSPHRQDLVPPIAARSPLCSMPSTRPFRLGPLHPRRRRHLFTWLTFPEGL